MVMLSGNNYVRIYVCVYIPSNVAWSASEAETTKAGRDTADNLLPYTERHCSDHRAESATFWPVCVKVEACW